MTRDNREVYVAPTCTVVSFKVDEDVAKRVSYSRPEYHIGNDALQEDDDPDLP